MATKTVDGTVERTLGNVLKALREIGSGAKIPSLGERARLSLYGELTGYLRSIVDAEIYGDHDLLTAEINRAVERFGVTKNQQVYKTAMSALEHVAAEKKRCSNGKGGDIVLQPGDAYLRA